MAGNREVKFELFKSSTKSWATMCAEAAAFANQTGPERIINISISEDQGKGVIVVWYRE